MFLSPWIISVLAFKLMASAQLEMIHTKSDEKTAIIHHKEYEMFSLHTMHIYTLSIYGWQYSI